MTCNRHNLRLWDVTFLFVTAYLLGTFFFFFGVVDFNFSAVTCLVTGKSLAFICGAVRRDGCPKIPGTIA